MNESLFRTSKINISTLKDLINDEKIYYYAKNYEILKLGKIVDKFYLIIEGKVKLINKDNKGNEFIVMYLNKGNTFGEGFIFNDTNEMASFSVVAIEDCKIFELSASELISYSQKHPDLLIEIIKVMHSKMCSVSEHVNNIAFNKPIEKIACVIYKLATINGKENAGKIEFPFNFTHQDIADMTGCARITVSRALHNLKDKNIINYHNHFLIIEDLDKLKAISNC